MLHTLAKVSLVAAALIAAAPMAQAAEEAPTPPNVDFSFEGPFGKFDPAQLQRGFKVYREVCAACHSAELLAFRNLGQPGGPQFSEAAVEVIASEYQVQDGPDDFGEMFERPGTPADTIPSPFPNDNAARAAQGGALPPDFSVIAKARPGGPEYLHALLTGYDDPPEGVELRQGMYYNHYFPGHQIAMAPPLSEGQVAYDDEAPETVEQYSQDVSAFLMWLAEPKLQARKELGLQVMIFLAVLAGLLFFTKRKLWRNIEH